MIEEIKTKQEKEEGTSAVQDSLSNPLASPTIVDAHDASPKPARKKSRLRRVVIAFLAIALLGVIYVKRDVLLKADSQPATSSETAPAKTELKVLYWQDPMHPSYKSDKPGKAPDCGMDLVPVYENGGGSSNLPEGAFQISPEKQQMIGVTYGVVTSSSVSKSLRAVARLAFDETKIIRIHTKVEGWIENVYVDFIGKQVTKGQPLISIYSPDLLQTQQEYLLALRGRSELSESPFREAVAGSESLLESARRRLELWDISETQIKDLEARGKPTKALTLYAPTNGFVLARNAFSKQRVTPDVELYQIADLSTIWAIADIYEYEASEIKIGQSATMTVSSYPGKTFKGQVSYIYPQLDNATRTLKVRIEFPNPDFTLKPDMYANVELKIDYGKKLTVPQEAVLDSGSEQLVFVALEGGYFEPRKIQLGAKVDNNFIVLGGLKPGERIATSANFLIDSESKLKSAAAGMGMPGMNHGGGSGGGSKQTNHSQHQQGGQPQAQPQEHSKHQSGGAAVPRSTPEDHSKHQPKSKSEAQMEDHSQHQVKPEGKILYWYDPMHPDYKTDKPGKAPDCGMDLVPKYADGK